MKLITTIFAFLLILLAGSGQAMASGGPLPGVCVPYTIPIQSTVTACGQGLQGAKYKTATKDCTTGATTISADYDMSGCVVLATSGQIPGRQRCVLTPEACASVPAPQNCPGGFKWTLAGSGTAHCVPEDPVCGWGTSLTHDTMGVPSCFPNTCPSNQSLQGDGISCACPANTVWTGSTCMPATPTCSEYAQNVNETACGAGFSGTMYQVQSTSCPAGPFGAPQTTTSEFVRTNCVSLAPTCTSTSTTESQTCGVEATGTMYRTNTTSCPSGAYGSPATTYGSWDTTSCGCANGGIDYPRCTPPQPSTPVCPETIYWCAHKGQQGQDEREALIAWGKVEWVGSTCRAIAQQVGSGQESAQNNYTCPDPYSYGVNWDEIMTQLSTQEP